MSDFRSRIRPALLALAALLAGGEVLACSCLPPGTPQEEMAKPWAASVFRGRVLQIEARGGLIERRHVTFEVSRVWQGARDPVHLVSTAGNSAACGFEFRAGVEYLVYEHQGGVSLCSRTRPAAEAAADFAALGPGQPPAADSLARVSRHAHLSGSWYNPARSGEGFVIETLDDDRGVVYWFGYDGDDPQRQAWMNGVGTFEGDQLHVAELQRPVGGGFGDAYRADRVQRPVWGSLTLTLAPDGDGEASFVPRGTLIPTTVSFPIQRLTRPPAPALPAALD